MFETIKKPNFEKFTYAEKLTAYKNFDAMYHFSRHEEGMFFIFGELPTPVFMEMYQRLIDRGNLHVLDVMRMTRDEKNYAMFQITKIMADMHGFTLKKDTKLMREIRLTSDDKNDELLLQYCVDFCDNYR